MQVVASVVIMHKKRQRFLTPEGLIKDMCKLFEGLFISFCGHIIIKGVKSNISYKKELTAWFLTELTALSFFVWILTLYRL